MLAVKGCPEAEPGGGKLVEKWDPLASGSLWPWRTRQSMDLGQWLVPDDNGVQRQVGSELEPALGQSRESSCALGLCQ